LEGNISQERGGGGKKAVWVRKKGLRKNFLSKPNELRTGGTTARREQPVVKISIVKAKTKERGKKKKRKPG